jgi:ADP-ribose pyrophosphatase YjhB (NUDIX family)
VAGDGRDDGTGAPAPTLAAAVVVRDSSGRVLLVREAYRRRRWGLPGGRLEPGESPHAAAVRETHEETGAAVELEALIAVYSLRTSRHGLRFVFAARIVAGEPAVPPGGEIGDLGWFAPDALPAPMTRTAPAAVADAAAGARGAFRDIDAAGLADRAGRGTMRP